MRDLVPWNPHRSLAHNTGDTLAKPKHHTLHHLVKYLDLYGPFRQMWCMPFEMFLQRLKQYCEMSNFQSVPYSVLCKWAMSRALLQSDPDSQSSSILETESTWLQIDRTPSGLLAQSQCSFHMLDLMCDSRSYV